MKLLTEYLSIKVKPSKIIADDNTINDIIESETNRLGLTADFNHINTERVTNLRELFENSRYNNFNGDISNWNVSNVKNFSRMFYRCNKFNCNLSKWDVSSAETMNYMFAYCSRFNSDISNWKFPKCRQMFAMLEHCTDFNQPIQKWDVSHINMIGDLLYNSTSFKQNLSNWEIYDPSVDFNDMFFGTKMHAEDWPRKMI